MSQPLSDFGRVLRKLFRFVRYASYGLTALMLVFLAFRVAEIYRFFADMHPIAGIAFLVVFAALFALETPTAHSEEKLDRWMTEKLLPALASEDQLTQQS